MLLTNVHGILLCSAGLTGDVLPASVAKELSQLSELCVLRTGIRKHADVDLQHLQHP
jgi:hypothetical protein